MGGCELLPEALHFREVQPPLCHRVSPQILTGPYMAVADIICFLLTLFPLCPPESWKTAGSCRDAPPCHRCRLAAACSELRALGSTVCPRLGSLARAPWGQQRLG